MSNNQMVSVPHYLAEEINAALINHGHVVLPRGLQEAMNSQTEQHQSGPVAFVDSGCLRNLRVSGFDSFSALLHKQQASMVSPQRVALYTHADPACAHEWTDDGEFMLTCTKCGAQENHEPHGWVQTRGNAINHFTQGWDVVEEWDAQGFEYKAMFDRADPAEVVGRLKELVGPASCDERITLRNEVERLSQIIRDLNDERDEIGAEAGRLRAQLSELKQAFGESQEEVVKRGKLLAERDAQAGQHKLAMDAACGEIAERDALLADISKRHWSGVDFDLPADLVDRIKALYASAEQSAPLYPKCSILKDCNVGYSTSSQGYVDPKRHEQGGLTSPSAPVERDDGVLIETLRTCEKWFVKHSPTAPLIGGFGDAEHPMLTFIRAALENKPVRSALTLGDTVRKSQDLSGKAAWSAPIRLRGPRKATASSRPRTLALSRSTR